ncbi:MAG: hydantoinase B/oxoprolinase family protein [Deltaproteobacteria bacterium]|nr:hydantoinase B/oxoprolinase family protein [Deltaproteobacteria bacterium]
MDQYRFAIDRGGTFTDIYAETPDGGFKTLKLLSADPGRYHDAPTEGILRIIREHEPGFKGKRIPSEKIQWIRMGTTIATNALLERKGARLALMITQGFEDLLEIGYQNRPELFDLEIKKPELLYSKVFPVKERVRLVSEKSGLEPYDPDNPVKIGLSGEKFEIMEKPELKTIKAQLKSLKEDNITSLAVVLSHSYAFDEHEKHIRELALQMKIRHVSISSEVMPAVKMVSRGDTCMVDAYLTPLLRDYLADFLNGFEGPLDKTGVLFMRSDGGLVLGENFLGSNAILSGPAGGVVGYAESAYRQMGEKPLIGFDMGGTSTDVSRFDGHYEIIFENETAGVRLNSPQLNINTVAAGGGSRLFFENGVFKVGPESSGAYPGPVCYANDGYLSLTDANLALGKIIPDYFPQIFGETKDQPLDKNESLRQLEALTQKINEHPSLRNTSKLSLPEVAQGFIKVANQKMIRSIREISVMKGFDLKEHVLVCFGGAGGQHACGVARELGIKEILIPRFGGILSAYGLGMADVVAEEREPCARILTPENLDFVFNKIKSLTEKAVNKLLCQGFSSELIQPSAYLNLRYEGTDTQKMLLEPADKDFKGLFDRNYLKEFGFYHPEKDILIDDIRVVAKAVREKFCHRKIKQSRKSPLPDASRRVFFEDRWHQTPVFLYDGLKAGQIIPSPAIIIQQTQTIVIDPFSHARINSQGDILIKLKKPPAFSKSVKADPVGLSIFNGLFMSIAEQMGRSLQKTAVSVNIKQRQDFSCAVFDRLGRLIANAPHQPVHLGAMSQAVQAQIRLLGKEIKKGDVLLSNHPESGGSHLPDLTVITPVYEKDRLAFFVASRGHHADVGGVTPGSIPPFSSRLEEEGVAISSFKLVRNNRFMENDIIQLLKNETANKKDPRIKGARAVRDNIADLKAQVAANQKGVELLGELCGKYSIKTVQSYMNRIRENAEEAVREMLGELSDRLGLKQVDSLEAEDFMDDGSVIHLKITLDRHARSAVFDFSKTARAVKGNWNCPKAVTYSAVLYCLRSMIKKEIPLNHGCLKPVKLVLKKNSLLYPGKHKAVVGGNVLTSQRIVDVILKAFRQMAASQGCMNNLTFGDDRFAYYETIGGGAGAGPGWNGQSAVHTHMSNTRITDPEILERNYPVLLRIFCIRKNSGGKGKFTGGNGIIREIEFLKPLQLSILSERRIYAPYGLFGGGNGQKGLNMLITKDNNTIDLGGKNSLNVQAGDRIRIETPGGGGFKT